MRTILLFCRSRRMFTATGLLIGLTVAGGLTSGSLVRVGQGTAQSIPSALLLLPAAAGALVAVSAHSPMPVWDRLGTARIPRARFAQAALLTATAALGAFAVLPDEVLDARGDAAAARNVIALCGIGLLTCAVTGAAAAWLPPLALAGLALTLGTETSAAWLWSWLLAPDPDLGAGVVAALLWSAGAGVFSFAGDRSLRGPAT
ncbi:hypothetical protein MHW47_08115 [Streptomyces sp. OfavH-34-F]|uniref:hypothetical protein n=1 Tax=Streptomyces sp. OfavH-34-F TaxID=2917760 RepID=UPI001EF209D3|nr:hypothetical protein [Streptomyces sp. OfavH-34-F]MCG7524398.1 hypothetical protein [Streptomyces sp. OfavH-34-F]